MRKFTGIHGLALIAAAMISAGMAHAKISTDGDGMADSMDDGMTYAEDQMGSKMVFPESRMEPNVSYVVDHKNEVALLYGKVDIDSARLGEHDAHGFGLQARGIHDNGLRFDLAAANVTSDTIVDQNNVALILRFTGE